MMDLDRIEGGKVGRKKRGVGRIDPYADMCRGIGSIITRIAVVVIERDVNRRGEAGRCLEREMGSFFSTAESI